MTASLLLAATLTVLGQTADVTYVSTITTDLEHPGRLAATGDGRIYVTEQVGGRVLEYDAAGALVATHAVPEMPVAIGVLLDGRIAVSRLDGEVAVYDATFTPVGLFDPAPLSMTAPNDIAVHPTTGEVFVVDSAEHRVLVFDGTTGLLVRAWGLQGSALGEFESPQAIAINSTLNQVIVADVDNFRGLVFDASGIFQFKFGYRMLYTPDIEVAWFARSEGLAVDSCGNIYIADALMGTIRVFDLAGKELDPDHQPAVGFGSGPGQLRVPCDVMIDGTTMYVANTNNSSVEVFELSCSAPPPAPARPPGNGRGLQATKSSSMKAAKSPANLLPTPPDNPFDLVDFLSGGRYSWAFDLNQDRRVDVADLEIVVSDFRGATLDDFVGSEPGLRGGYDAPHVIDLPYSCGRCHAMDGLPGGMLTDWGQENLCLSCHGPSKLAMSTPIAGGQHEMSHPWGVAADSGEVAGPDPDSELALHLDAGKIRCATCHDPHTSDNGAPYLRATIEDAALCAECHLEGQEWEFAGHSDEESEAFTYPIGPSRRSCVMCHSGLGYIDFAAGLPPSEQRTDMQVIACFVCHGTHGYSQDETLMRVYDEVTLPGGLALTDRGTSATCMVCHNGRRAPDGVTTTPHYALGGAMLVGTNGVTFGATIANSPHSSVAECVDCHMAPSPATGQPGANKVGGHSFNIIVDIPGDPDDGFENVGNACNAAACHGSTGALTTVNRTAYGDYDGDGTVEGVQDEVSGLRELVFAEIIAKGAVYLGHHPYWDLTGVDPDEEDLVRDAIWNYEYVGNDRSLGVHNTGYAVGLLQATYEALTGDAVPDAELRYVPADFSETVVEIQDVNGGAPVEVGGPFTVDFTIVDEDGHAIPRDTLDRLLLYVGGPSDNYQRVIAGDSAASHFTQNPDGSYTYTAAAPFPAVYLAPVNDSPAFGPGDGEMAGQPLLEGTYTVLIESRRTFSGVRKAGDATFDFVVADDPLVPPPLAPRQFVLRQKCNDCHLDIQLHGSNRYAVTGCAICHTVGSEDFVTAPETTPGVTIKLDEMIHRIHYGNALPSVAATAHGADPYRYEIIGRSGSVNDFSDVGFPVIPDGVMKCAACHGDAAQGEEIYVNATQSKCTSCHDGLDFATGTLLDETDPDVADGLLSEADLTDPAYRVDIGHDWADGTCLGCHGDISPLGVEVIHQHPTRLEQEGLLPQVEIVSVGGMTGGGGTYFVAGDYPEFTFKLKNVNDDPLQLVTGDRSVFDRIEVIVMGPTVLYQNIIDLQRPWSNGSLAVDPAQWIDNFAVDGTYTFISEDPFPVNYPPQPNSIGEPPEEQIFSFDGGWGQQYTAAGTPLDSGTYTVVMYGRRTTPVAGEREPARSDTFDVPFGTDDPLVPYAGTVDTASCNACHGVLAFHGNAREGVMTCLACHTAGAQDGGTYESVDLRIMVHKLHNARNLDVVAQGGAYELAGFSGIADFSHLLISSMPGEAAECQVCHVNDVWKSPPLRTNMRTWMAVCTSCHDSDDTAAHVDFMTLPGTFVEMCFLCHGEGAVFSIEKSHASP